MLFEQIFFYLVSNAIVGETLIAVRLSGPGLVRVFLPYGPLLDGLHGRPYTRRQLVATSAQLVGATPPVSSRV